MSTGRKVRNSDEKLQNKNKAHTKKLTPRNIRNENVNQRTSPVHEIKHKREYHRRQA